jgi:hypothetical protein
MDPKMLGVVVQVHLTQGAIVVPRDDQERTAAPILIGGFFGLLAGGSKL